MLLLFLGVVPSEECAAREVLVASIAVVAPLGPRWSLTGSSVESAFLSVRWDLLMVV